jgi:WD40 repeat protein
MDGTLELRDLRGVEEPRQWQAHEEGPVTAVALSPDGCRVATGGGRKDARLRVWEVQNIAVPVAELVHDFPISAIAMSPDGRWVVTGSVDNGARCWDVRARDPSAQPVLLEGHTDHVVAVAVSADGRWVITGSQDRTARLWDLDRPAEPLLLPGHSRPVGAVALSLDGRHVATGSHDHVVRLWDRHALAAGPRVLAGHDGLILSLAFDAESRWLASGSADLTARLWDLRAHDRFGHATLLAKSQLDSDVQVDVLAGAIDTEGDVCVAGFWREAAHLWELPVDHGSCQATLLKEQRDAGRATSIAITPDRRWLAMGWSDGTVRSWDLHARGAEPSLFRDHASAVEAVALSPDGRWLVSGAAATIKVRDGKKEVADRVYRWQRGFITAVAISRDGRRLAAGSSDGVARVWDLHNPAARPVEFPGHRSPVSAVDISPDGQWLVTGILADPYGVRIWQVRDPAIDPVLLTGHTDSVSAVAINPDGRWFVTASVDGTARYWRLTLEELLGQARLVVGREFRRAEWNQEFPGEAPRKVFEP